MRRHAGGGRDVERVFQEALVLYPRRWKDDLVMFAAVKQWGQWTYAANNAEGQECEEEFVGFAWR